MAPSFYERFLRPDGHKPTKLTEVAAQLQRTLSKLGQIEKPLQALAPGTVIPEALKALGGLKMPGLDSLLHQKGPAKRADTGMVAHTFASQAGSRPYKTFVPPTLQPGAPLLVMLHGCTQSADDFAAGTRMNELAAEEGFVVLYPEQPSSANAQRCWNWFNPHERQRDHGEAGIIADMTRHVTAELGINPKRVFAAGLSAGGAQAAVLGSIYPDLFAAIGVHSGLACGAANDMMSAFSAMQQGRPGQGDLTVPAILFHGDRDTTVNPRNADAVAAQLEQGGTEHTEKGTAPGGLSYTRKIRQGTDSRPSLEQWTIHGAGHAWSGGSSNGSYTEPRGPDASREMLRFFLSV
jgi:poly(hydroxyalkanoate) depolymerase family esterase